MFYLVGAAIGGGLIASAASLGTSHHRVGIGGLMVGILFLIVWMGGLTRLKIMGIYVSDAGLRYRGPMSTSTIPWASVKAVRFGTLNLRWFGEASRSKAIWIDCTDRDSIPTWINDKGVEFIGHRVAFERALSDIKTVVQSHRPI
jgi:hypothetical protein